MATRVVFKEKELIVTVPHKCGSTAFQAATVPGLAELAASMDVHVGNLATQYWIEQGIGPLEFHEALELYPDYRNLMSVRDPVTRFISTWDDFCFRTKDPNQDVLWPCFNSLRGLSLSEFLDYIEKAPGSNGHWWPQYIMAMPDSHFIPSDHLLEYLGLPNVRIHKGHREKGAAEVTEGMVQRLRVLYRFDFALYEQAKLFDRSKKLWT